MTETSIIKQTSSKKIVFFFCFSLIISIQYDETSISLNLLFFFIKVTSLGLASLRSEILNFDKWGWRVGIDG
jgi:hypothetical protein